MSHEPPDSEYPEGADSLPPSDDAEHYPIQRFSDMAFATLGLAYNAHKNHLQQLQQEVDVQKIDMRATFAAMEGGRTDYNHVPCGSLASGAYAIGVFWQGENLRALTEKGYMPLERDYYAVGQHLNLSDAFKTKTAAPLASSFKAMGEHPDWAIYGAQEISHHIQKVSNAFDEAIDPKRILAGLIEQAGDPHFILETAPQMIPVAYPLSLHKDSTDEELFEIGAFLRWPQFSYSSYLPQTNENFLHCHTVFVEPAARPGFSYAESALAPYLQKKNLKLLPGKDEIVSHAFSSPEKAAYYTLRGKVYQHQEYCWRAFTRNAQAVESLTGYTVQDHFITEIARATYLRDKSRKDNHIERFNRDVMNSVRF